MPVPKLLLHTNDFYSTQILTNDILRVVAVLMPTLRVRGWMQIHFAGAYWGNFSHAQL